MWCSSMFRGSAYLLVEYLQLERNCNNWIDINANKQVWSFCVMLARNTGPAQFTLDILNVKA